MFEIPSPTPYPSPSVVAAEYRAGGRPIRWTVDDSLLRDSGLQARNESARMMVDMSLDDAAPLNGSLPPAKMSALVETVERHLMVAPFYGLGIDLGAGLGVLASVVGSRPAVNGVLALEVCDNFVESVIPRVAREVLGSRADRVVPVLGSFDHLEIDSETLDFAIEMHSFHHAQDLDAVLVECHRVLKHGGQLVCLDRAQPDDMTDEYRDHLLDRVYGEEWLEANGYPTGITMTRRDNGEHEIRMSEWLAAFQSARFTVDRVIQFSGGVDFRLAAKSSVSRLPKTLRTKLLRVPVHRGYDAAWLRSRLGARERVGSVVFAPQSPTGFALRKC